MHYIKSIYNTYCLFALNIMQKRMVWQQYLEQKRKEEKNQEVSSPAVFCWMCNALNTFNMMHQQDRVSRIPPTRMAHTHTHRNNAASGHTYTMHIKRKDLPKNALSSPPLLLPPVIRQNYKLYFMAVLNEFSTVSVGKTRVLYKIPFEDVGYTHTCAHTRYTCSSKW